MDEIKSKIGYIRGLMDGMELSDSTKEGKVFSHIVEVLDQMADALQNLDDDQQELVDYVDAIEEDLTELEEDFDEYLEDEEDDDEDDISEFKGHNDCCSLDFGDDMVGEFTFECPNCREIVYIDEDILDEDEDMEILCPGCGEVVLINDWDDEDPDLITDEDSVKDNEDK